MNSEDIARKYRNAHPGYRLVGYADCGLPFTETAIPAYTIEYKKLSPIFEFTLKAIKAGIDDRQSLGSFLGLDPDFLKDVLSQLLSSGDISLQERLRLTDKGTATLEKAESASPIEQTINIDFDRTLERPMALFSERRLAPRDLKDEGLLEIPAIPAKRIDLNDLNIDDIQAVLDRAAKTASVPRRVLLSLKEVGRQTSKYRPALALRYENGSGEQLISFAIDGILNKELEEAFARKKGIAKLNLQYFQVDEQSSTVEIFADYEEQIPTDLTVAHLEDQTTVAKIALADAKDKVAAAASPSEHAVALAELKSHNDHLDELDDELKKVTTVRSLAVFDHPDVLVDALENSTHRLMIISPWITRKVVNKGFLQRIENLLRKNVAVYIGYGMAGGSKGNDEWAIRKLNELVKQFSNLTFVNFGDTHAKVLLSDDRYFVVSSFNWLSFKGDPAAIFRDEQGLMISRQNLVNEKFEEQVARFRPLQSNQ